MEATIQSAIIASSSALIGGIISGCVTWQVTLCSMRAQLDREVISRRMADEGRRREWKRERLERAHKIASSIGFEYSLTGLRIDWGNRLTPQQIDEKYLGANEKISEFWVIADAASSEFGSEVKELRNEMNVFWGYFREMMRREHEGEKIEDTLPFHEAYKYAELINSRASALRETAATLLREL